MFLISGHCFVNRDPAVRYSLLVYSFEKKMKIKQL